MVLKDIFGLTLRNIIRVVFTSGFHVLRVSSIHLGFPPGLVLLRLLGRLLPLLGPLRPVLGNLPSLELPLAQESLPFQALPRGWLPSLAREKLRVLLLPQRRVPRALPQSLRAQLVELLQL